VLADRNRPHHGHQEFLRFLNRLERDIPADKLAHVVLDNDGSHTRPKLRVWPARHRRWTFHFTPTSASWLNAVEGFFAELTRVVCNGACSVPLSTHKPRSTGTSPITMPARNHSSGRPTLIPSLLRQTEGTKR
jgi:DDE superfamily endonuclease